MSDGKVDKVKGKANEVAGVLTGKRSKEAKGKAQQVKGGVKDKVAEKDQERQEKGAEQNG